MTGVFFSHPNAWSRISPTVSIKTKEFTLMNHFVHHCYAVPHRSRSFTSTRVASTSRLRWITNSSRYLHRSSLTFLCVGTELGRWQSMLRHKIIQERSWETSHHVSWVSSYKHNGSLLVSSWSSPFTLQQLKQKALCHISQTHSE